MTVNLNASVQIAVNAAVFYGDMFSFLRGKLAKLYDLRLWSHAQTCCCYIKLQFGNYFAKSQRIAEKVLEPALL